MKRITVYTDFDFLSSPREIGTLGYERVRGKDHFVFVYSNKWLKQYGGILLSGDLLLDRRERLMAQSEGRPKRMH